MTNLAILRELSFGAEHFSLMVVHKGPPVRKSGHILRALLQQMFAKETLNDRPTLRKSTGFLQACVCPVNGDAAVLDAVDCGRREAGLFGNLADGLVISPTCPT